MQEHKYLLGHQGKRSICTETGIYFLKPPTVCELLNGCLLCVLL